MSEVPFWKQKTLREMSRSEWESLCDGCGQCCLHKIEDEDTGEISITDVACKLLDLKSCRCSNYPHRRKHVSDCQILTPKKLQTGLALPPTCAYRLCLEGKDLYNWHPLVSGVAHSVHKAGISVRGKAVPEHPGIKLMKHIIPRELL